MNTDRFIIELGQRVLKLRKKLNISQSDLAKNADITKNYLGELERGKRTNVSVAVIVRIANALGTTTSELFADIEQDDFSDENEESFANALYQRRMEDACYPPQLENFAVTTLMQFLIYLPLIKPQHLLDSLQRIGGSCKGYESYVMKQVNTCISKIPPSPAKKYADTQAMNLRRDTYMKNKDDTETFIDSNDDGYEEYLDRIQQIDQFLKACVYMRDSFLKDI